MLLLPDGGELGAESFPAPMQRGWRAGQPGRDAGTVDAFPPVLPRKKKRCWIRSRSPTGRATTARSHTSTHADWLNEYVALGYSSRVPQTMLPCRREAAVMVLRRGAVARCGEVRCGAEGASSPPVARMGRDSTVCLNDERRWSGFKRGDGVAGLRGRSLIRLRCAYWHGRCAQPSYFSSPLCLSPSKTD